MMNFITWFLGALADFLMCEPVCYFVGFFFLFCAIAVVRQIVNFHR